jgi:hypothetical protein
MRRIIHQVVELKWYWLSVVVLMVCSYGLYLVLPDETVEQIGWEDQLFENLTVLFFLGAAYFFVRNFLAGRNAWFLLLAIVFFVGAGEEISWGQRVFGFQTPDVLSKINVQHEFTLHNIEVLNAHDFQHNLKGGLAKLLTVNFLYKLFWLAYCILLPLLCLCAQPVSKLAEKMRLPIPPLTLGLLFAVNWVVFKGTSVFLLPVGKDEQYYDTIGEMAECMSALIFMVIAIWFVNLHAVRRAETTHPAPTQVPSPANL